MSRRQPDRSALTSRVVSVLASAYDLECRPTAMAGREGATNTVMKVATDRGEAIVRLHQPGASEAHLAAVHHVQDALRDHGLPIPRIWNTRDGASWSRLDGRLLEVLSFVPGGHEVETWDDAGVLFRALGALHRVLRTIDTDGFPPLGQVCFTSPATALSLLDATDDVFDTTNGDPDVTTVAAVRHAVRQMLARLLAIRPRYVDVIPRTLIHGDFVGFNVLIEGDEVVAIIDFDRLAVQHRLYEVAYSLMYVLSRLVRIGVRQPASDDGLTGDDLTCVTGLLETYSRASGWPLTVAERQALPYEMALAPLYPLATAGMQPDDAVVETLIFAPSVPLAAWLVTHASSVSDSLGNYGK